MTYGTSLTEVFRHISAYTNPHPQGHQPRRPTGSAVDQVRFRHQSHPPLEPLGLIFRRPLLARADEVLE